MDLQQEEVDKASSGLEDPSVATTMQVPIVDEAVAAEDAEGPGEDGMDSDGTRRSEDISGRGSPDDWLMIGAVDAEMDLALEAAGIGASLVAQVNGEDPTQQQIPPHSDDGVEEGQDEKVNEYDEDKFGDLVVESSVPLPYAVVAQEEELEGASACTASFGDEVVVDEEDACKGQDTIARIDDLTRFDGAPPKPEPSSSPEACPALVEAVGEESADDSAALRARVEKLEAELAQRRSDVQTLEKHCVRVENRLQEAEAVVASALACLGLTRDRMTALAASTQDTLSRLAPHATVASHSDAKEDQDVSPPPSSAPWGGASVRIEEPPRLVLPAVMGDIDRAFAAVERSTSSALSELQGHVVAANEAVKVHAILPEATPIASGTEDVAAPDAERVPSHTLRNGDGNRDKGDRIAVRAFAEGDVVMFFPTPRGDYVAFNVGAPNYFLSEESKALIGHDKYFKKVYVLGRVVFIERRVAGTQPPTMASVAVDSAHGLPPGTDYFEVSVESVSDTYHGHLPLHPLHSRGPPLPPHLREAHGHPPHRHPHPRPHAPPHPHPPRPPHLHPRGPPRPPPPTTTTHGSSPPRKPHPVPK